MSFMEKWRQMLRVLLVLISDVLFEVLSSPLSGAHEAKRRIQYLLQWYQGSRHNQAFIERTKRFRQEQDKLLENSLRTNSNTEYSLTNLKGVTKREQFQSVHPIVTYERYRDLVERAVDGEHNLLCSGQFAAFAFTSGTTGKSKKIPISQHCLDYFSNFATMTITYLASTYNPKIAEGRKVMRIGFPVRKEETKSGVQIGALSGFVKGFEPCTADTTTPVVTLDGLQEAEVTYIHLLFGLKDRRIALIQTSTSSLLHNTFVFLEKYWEKLVEDIRKGTLSSDLKIPQDVRAEIEKHHSPNVKRANELKKEFEAGFVGVVSRIWPDVKLISVITSGSFKLYADMLESRYTKSIVLYSYLYGSSEAFFGINMHPGEQGEPKYVLEPTGAFFEFIPIELAGTDLQKALLPEQCTVGEEYELVVSNVSGFYRYAMGDVVRLVGFYNQAPIVNFMYRRGQLLNIHNEKTSEVAVCSSLTAALRELDGTALVDYACAESGWLNNKGDSDTPFYAIFVELSPAERRSAQFISGLQESIDKHLMETAQRYGHYRRIGGLSPLRVYLLKPGAFSRLLQFRLANSKSALNQIKAARVLTSQLLEFVTSEVDELD